MKFLIHFALTFFTAFALHIHNSKLGITNGKTATVGQFPYQVGIAIVRSSKDSWCGGSLIGSQWVLTAAHCIEYATSVTVFLGATERTKAEVKYTVNLSNFFIHGDYDTTNNDIALIKIPPTTYTEKIQPVKLPAISSSYSTYTGKMSIATGWGRISDSATTLAKDMQWARLKVITNEDCDEIYDDIISSKLCVSTDGGASTCHGDSGGPLVLESSMVQIGVTAAGDKEGCTMGYPETFTRVTSYLFWIKAKTATN